eukprot:Clim_evm6s50 gene=Clim_evmTU6s50
MTTSYAFGYIAAILVTVIVAGCYYLVVNWDWREIDTKTDDPLPPKEKVNIIFHVNSTFRNWKRWVAFLVIMAAFFVTFPFIPLSGEDKLPEDTEAGEWYSMLPPWLTIALAACFHEILVALFISIFIGGMIATDGNPWEVYEQFIWNPVTDPFNAFIIGFTLALVGAVLIMKRSGGLDGMLELIGHLARTPYTTRLTIALMGLVVFFDDYGNAIIVGNTARGLSDKMQISREKLAYLIDSTAAPIAGIAIVSTWIAFEVGLFQDVANSLGIDMTGYELFLQCLPYRYYCMIAILIVFISNGLGRDFGPMFEAEKRAAETGKLVADDATPMIRHDTELDAPTPGKPKRWENAVVPLFAIVFGSLIGIFVNGCSYVEGSCHISDPVAWREAFGNSDSSYVLFIVAVIGALIAAIMPIYQRLLTVEDCVISFLHTIPAMAFPITLLILAFGIKAVCDAMGTATYLIALLGDIDLEIVPFVVFLLAAITAIASGTSFGTMGILLPIALPLAYGLATPDPDSALGIEEEVIFYLTGAAVLDGAIFGDHCSPISDTTVLSSTAAAADHLHHVKTQMPYAFLGAVIATGLGYLPVAYGMPMWIAYPAFVIIIFGVYFIVGKKIPETIWVDEESSGSLENVAQHNKAKEEERDAYLPDYESVGDSSGPRVV